MIRVGFPNTVYLTIEHSGQEIDPNESLFSFEFWYQNLDNTDFESGIAENFEIFEKNKAGKSIFI